MDGVVSTIIGVALSNLICSFLLNILNNNMWSVFNVIRKDLNKLTNMLLVVAARLFADVYPAAVRLHHLQKLIGSESVIYDCIA